ncbi:MAG: type II toxin-antitoxin system HicA family toxin [Candidatus Peribacteraceae bacterium]|nr:type II toxin-antitoxin system HicA family toxin [Candidatus Peribacteraceae bacterium]
MPKLPRTSERKILATLERMGLVIVRRRGSHIILRKKDRGCVLPDHDEVAVGTLRSVLRQADISPEEFLKNFDA